MAEDLGSSPRMSAPYSTGTDFPAWVLLFAFDSGGGSQHHAPHSYVKRDYAYTGTHDNNTVRGWLQKEAGREEKEHLSWYLGDPGSGRSASTKQ